MVKPHVNKLTVSHVNVFLFFLFSWRYSSPVPKVLMNRYKRGYEDSKKEEYRNHVGTVVANSLRAFPSSISGECRCTCRGHSLPPPHFAHVAPLSPPRRNRDEDSCLAVLVAQPLGPSWAGRVSARVPPGPRQRPARSALSPGSGKLGECLLGPSRLLHGPSTKTLQLPHPLLSEYYYYTMKDYAVLYGL